MENSLVETYSISSLSFDEMRDISGGGPPWKKIFKWVAEQAGSWGVQTGLTELYNSGNFKGTGSNSHMDSMNAAGDPGG